VKKVAFIFLPFTFLLYIAAEIFLKLNNSSLCHSTGCELAGNLLRFNSIILNYIGFLAVLALVVLGTLSYKRYINKTPFFIFLYSMIAFETVLLGYQFFASPAMCKFCMGVYAFLITIALMSSSRYLFIALPSIISAFVALSFLAIPVSKTFISQNTNYLIGSQNCPHCKKTEEYLKKHNISFIKIDINSIETKNFLYFLDFKTIPVLVVKNHKDTKIINGDKAIISFFEKTSKPKEELQNISIDTLLNSSPQDEGCGFDITKSDGGCGEN